MSSDDDVFLIASEDEYMAISWVEGVTTTKDPNATKPYAFDWSAWLGEDALIEDSEWIIVGQDDALTNDEDSVLSGSVSTQVIVSSGTANQNYMLTNRITTNETPARVDDRSIIVRVREQ
jgi:hypothetical protein